MKFLDWHVSLDKMRVVVLLANVYSLGDGQTRPPELSVSEADAFSQIWKDDILNGKRIRLVA